mgnify:FL=1
MIGISLGMEIDQVARAIEENPDAKAVLVNNPTYYGICSDLKSIVALAHSKGIKVLTDEAHGTHLYFGKGLPISGMAAGAICYIKGGDTDQIGHACAMALKNLMGLVCDPVGGLVEVPCVKRNVGGAVNALAAADMALAGITSKVPVDQVIDAMKEVGDKMDVSLRETGVGGVAGTAAAQEVVEKLGM